MVTLDHHLPRFIFINYFDRRVVKDYFTKHDFEITATMAIPYVFEVCAHIANEKLNKLIESSPVVYCDNEYTSWSQLKSPTFSDKKKARLMFIEEIVKECVKHEPIKFQYDEGHLAMNPICAHCGVELVAFWSVKK
jgi:hypothetical protein